MCESGLVDDLICFVVVFDGIVVLDIKCKFFGCGCWVKVECFVFEKVIVKNFFVCVFKNKVMVLDGFVD